MVHIPHFRLTPCCPPRGFLRQRRAVDAPKSKTVARRRPAVGPAVPPLTVQPPSTQAMATTGYCAGTPVSQSVLLCAVFTASQKIQGRINVGLASWTMDQHWTDVLCLPGWARRHVRPWITRKIHSLPQIPARCWADDGSGCGLDNVEYLFRHFYSLQDGNKALARSYSI